jgi:hypothetical protein
LILVKVPVPFLQNDAGENRKNLARAGLENRAKILRGEAHHGPSAQLFGLNYQDKTDNNFPISGRSNHRPRDAQVKPHL